MIKSDIDFSTLPDAPGVYIFSKGRTVVYVGKATSLRSRVRSYFDPLLPIKRSPLVAKVIDEATSIRTITTDSVLEALLLEASKIKEYSPVGNTDAKDDKSYNYVVITNEAVPRLLVVRGRSLNVSIAPGLIDEQFGPFVQGGALKEALKIIRKIFPYYDTTYPINGTYSKQQLKTLTFNQSIGVYPRTDELAQYKKHISYIKLLFAGKKSHILKSLEKSLAHAVKELRFEDASVIKRQLFALTHIQETSLIGSEYRDAGATNFRIEAYDTAHMRGAAARGVMVVVDSGESVKSEYRVFSIEGANGDDHRALAEIMERRFAHPEWPRPQLIVIDGGAQHFATATKTLKKLGLAIEHVAVVKDERHRPREILGKRATIDAHKTSILLANTEAHRFSLNRHRKALRKGAILK